MSAATVAVPVSTLWTEPAAVRPIDRRAVATVPDIAGWTRSLGVADRLDLLGRVESQLLYGEPVRVVEERAGWVRVTAADQPSSRDPAGYPGWLPSAHLGEPFPAELAAGPQVVVTARTARLAGSGFELSFGTRLPLLSGSGRHAGAGAPGEPAGSVLVACPGSRPDRLAAADVELVAGRPPALGERLVAAGAAFVGLPYLWGGVSAYGFDCSGFVHAVHRRFGLRVPRDAHDQAVGGAPVPLDRLRPGDLVFFGEEHGRGFVHHVAIVAGSGRILHAPASGRSVEIQPLSTPAYAAELCAGRRYG